jgi:cob(I)alamin adenosyltransferase
VTTRITRVYTRTGDRGQTGLVGGKRVRKDAARIEAYGTVDELNSWVGVVRARVVASALSEAARDSAVTLLTEIQQQLFDLGAQLAAPAPMRSGLPQVGPADIAGLEQAIDRCQAGLTPLPSFVLPGGGEISGLLHLCRTVCRRAERRIVRLSRSANIGPSPVIYVNRLSDLLFVLSRWIGKQLGEPETLWQPRRSRSRPIAD